MLMVQRVAIGTLSVSFLACVVGCAAASTPMDSEKIGKAAGAQEVQDDPNAQAAEEAPPPDDQSQGEVLQGDPGYGAPGYGYGAPGYGAAVPGYGYGVGVPGYGYGYGGVIPGMGYGTGYGTGYASSWSSGAHCDTLYGCVYW